ncbi:NADP-dependent oxidoreductase [Burkholderia stagnalis]|uniref:NADP-dependent oxidoreductase n=1 Tax=Burkholderia stagnalis TaxID=1503054 RepID=UPI000ACBFD1D|nr:NADP-dependent oxidoreductase [Burkholderia stagnalis]VWB14569.1 zinc-binding alcohol dehydrogenase [Burkholderia stagnalis]
MALTDISTQIQLARRPNGQPVVADFATVEVPLPPLSAGEIRVRNDYVSVDPYMRGRMDDRPSYVEPFKLNETMTGAAIGRVVESASGDFSPGDLVLHRYGWRDVAQAAAEDFARVDEVPGLPASVHLGALGATGMTAYVGLLAVARLRAEDVVFVSAAAGAVGSLAGQIARLKGAARVIGSAGSDAKVAAVRDRYGYDAAFNYRRAPVLEQLRAAAPAGIDVYFDNVGGDHLEAALATFNYGGRAAICGAISRYDDVGAAPGPRFMENIVYRSLTLTGFLLHDYRQYRDAFVDEMAAWLRGGQVVFDETIVDGIRRAPDAFIGLMNGTNTGKMLVRIA